MMRFQVASLILVAAACYATPKTGAYDDALRKGRALQSQSDHAGAVKAFEEALTARPSDPVALSELGYSALQAGDLARAETATNAAIAHATNVSIKAASLYNLGLIRERKGQNNEAAEAYRESISLRPSPAASKRLAALSSKAPPTATDASKNSYHPVSAAGPFPSLQAYCDQQEAKLKIKGKCFIGADAVQRGPVELAKPTKPLRAVRVFSFGDEGAKSTFLGMQVETGWYVQPLKAEALATVDDLALRSARDQPVILARVTEIANVTDSENGRWFQECDQRLTVCGVGPSKMPSCTPALDVAEADCQDYDPSDEEKSPKWKWHLKSTVRPDGQLELSGKGKLPNNARAIIGVHPLAFP